jgi:hypothetical protein
MTISLLSVLLAPLGFWFYGLPGVWSVLAAGGLSGATGLAAFGVARHFLGVGQVVIGVLGAMAIRMGIPLFVCLALALRGGGDSLAGFVYFLLAFYLATLAVETWFAVPVANLTDATPASE